MQNLGYYIQRLPWWLAIIVVIGYGLFVGWDTGYVVISAWKASLLSNLAILGWQVFTPARALPAPQKKRKPKPDQTPRSRSFGFTVLEFLFLAVIIIIAHMSTFHLALMLTFSNDKELWAQAIESFSDFSGLAVIPFAIWMTKQATARGVREVRLWEHSVRLFLVVWVCYGISLFNMLLGVAISAWFPEFSGSPSDSRLASWWIKISYFLGIYLFLSIPPEKIWQWSDKHLKEYQ